MNIESGILSVMMIFMVLIFLFALLYAIASYLLIAISLYLLAKDRNIQNPWMSFIPFCDNLIIGALAEDVYIGKKKIPHPGLWLLIGDVIILPFSITELCLSISQSLKLDEAFLTIPFVGVAFFSIFRMVLSLALLVYTGFVIYNLFQKYDSEKALFFTIISCVIPIVFPILLLCVRKKYKKPIEYK